MSVSLVGFVEGALGRIDEQLQLCAQSASDILVCAAAEVLSGQRSGRVYRINGGSYRASAPGEAPGHGQSGSAALGARVNAAGIRPGIVFGAAHAAYLEQGTNKMAPRPFLEAVVERARPEIEGVYRANTS